MFIMHLWHGVPNLLHTISHKDVQIAELKLSDFWFDFHIPQIAQLIKFSFSLPTASSVS